MIPVMYSTDDVYRRLHGNACVYKGKVYYVSARSVPYHNLLEVDEVFLYPFHFRAEEYFTLDKQNTHGILRVKYTDPDVVIKGLNPGYANVNNNAGYFIRCPNRSTHLGLHPNNTLIPDVYSGVSNAARTFYTEPMAKALLGNYEPFNVCLEKIKSEPSIKGVAFSKDMALVKFDKIVHRLEIRGVGVAYSVGDSIKFTPANPRSFRIYEEELAEAGVKLN